MRLLLDECVPKRLKGELRGHEVKTVQDMGWAGIKNGALLKLADVRRVHRSGQIEAEGLLHELFSSGPLP